jgi:hypothetical protein
MGGTPRCGGILPQQAVLGSLSPRWERSKTGPARIQVSWCQAYSTIGSAHRLSGEIMKAYKNLRLMSKIYADSWIPAYAGMTSCPWKRASREVGGWAASSNQSTDFIHEPSLRAFLLQAIL